MNKVGLSRSLHTYPLMLPSYTRRILRVPAQNRIRPSSTFTTATGQSLPITDHAPVTSCECEANLPPGLDIDHSRPLANTVAPYNQHIVIATGKSDWSSRIEDEEGEGNMARTLKDMTRRGGDWYDVSGCWMIHSALFVANATHRAGPV